MTGGLAGLIAGSGVAESLSSLPGEAFVVPTEFGVLRGRFVNLPGVRIALALRHSAGHKTTPERVNYRAMAVGLKKLGAHVCLSSGAVGSLRPDWAAGTLANCSDFLDFSGRNLSIFESTVRHTDFSAPFSPVVRAALTQAASEQAAQLHPAAVYVCTNGPRYETPAEVAAFRQLGGDIVGMTVGSEASAMREAGLPYGCLAVVTNFASGVSNQPLSHEEVLVEMKRSNEKVQRILFRALEIAVQG